MAWYHRLYNAVRGERLSRELEREIATHIAERTDDLVAAGMSEPDAAAAARRRFGNRTAQKERAREADAMVWLETLAADVRYAVRALRASPGYTVVAVLSLGLGIGANTAVFSLTNALALRALPVSHPEQLVAIGIGNDPILTNPIWEEVRRIPRLFEGALAFSSESFNLSRSGVVRRARGGWVSGGFFDVLGVRSAAGHLLQPADDVRGCAATTVVSAGFAVREFGSAAAAVGRTLSFDGQPFQVIGVVQPGFSGIEVGQAIDVYAPICAQVYTTRDPKVLDERSRWYLNVIVRERTDMSLARLRARLATASSGVFAATRPGDLGTASQREYLGNTLTAKPATTGLSDLRDTYQQALTVVMVVVGVVLLIACANIANLLVARAVTRRREVAIRLAIGASRWRLIRQLLTESLVLSLSGALLGIGFARWASHLLVGFLSDQADPVWLDLSLDARVLGFTIAIATLTGVLFGLAPAWSSSRVDPQSAMKSGGRGVLSGTERHRLGRALVIAQVALSLALVTAAGLLVGSFRRLVTLDPGFQRDGVYLVQLDFGAAGLKGHDLVTIPGDVLRRVRELPGVTSASLSALTPISHTGWNDFVLVPGAPSSSRRDSLAFFNQVSDRYFVTLGTRLLAGRDITADDIAAGRSVAVINETMAHRFFGTASPIGRTFRTPVGDSAGPPREVIGVVRDAKYLSLEESPKATAYYPLGVSDGTGPVVHLEIRTARPPAELLRSVRDIALAASPVASLDMTSFAAQVSASLLRPRLLATLSGFFGGLALLLAVIGLYGTMSYSVTRRRNEIGIRMALGAGNSRVLRMIVREAGWLVGAGVACGAVLALASTRVLGSFLFGVTPTDRTTLAVSAMLLAVIAMAAAAAPAWRAARLDPMSALRQD